MPPKVYLLSRGLDPILAVFTGLLAYHLSETNPRSNIQPGHTLRELARWQWGVWKADREAHHSLLEGTQMPVKEDPDWERVRKELEGSLEGKGK